jgi:hypothetical protein
VKSQCLSVSTKGVTKNHPCPLLEKRRGILSCCDLSLKATVRILFFSNLGGFEEVDCFLCKSGLQSGTALLNFKIHLKAGSSPQLAIHFNFSSGIDKHFFNQV